VPHCRQPVKPRRPLCVWSAGPPPTHNVAERSCDLWPSVGRAGDRRIRQVSRRQRLERNDRLVSLPVHFTAVSAGATDGLSVWPTTHGSNGSQSPLIGHKIYLCIFTCTIFSSDAWAYQISWSSAVWVCECVWNKSQPLHTGTYNLACADLLMNPDRMPKTRSVWPILQVKIARRKKWENNGIQGGWTCTLKMFKLAPNMPKTANISEKRNSLQHLIRTTAAKLQNQNNKCHKR